MTVLRETRDALTDGVLVITDAARLLVRHFPALLTVFLLGTAAHNGVMWAAVRLGRDHAVAASMLVPLAPLSMVVALVAMLRIAGRALVGDDEPSGGRRLAVLTAALVPFLTVYTVSGQLEQDRFQFINESYIDEKNLGNFLSAEGLNDRSILTLDHLQLVLVVVFLVIRLVIDVLDLEERHTAWGLVQAVVEVTWLTWLATLLTRRWQDVGEWFGDRQVVAWSVDAWRSATGWLGPFTEPLRALGAVLSDTVDHVGTIVVTPVAWLAVGAVVIVGGLPQQRRDRTALPAAALQVRDSVAPRVARLRSRRGGAKLLELLGRRFGDLVDGLRVLGRAGLLPLLVFCLLLPLARLVEWGAALLLRPVIGPREGETILYFAPYLDIVTEAAYTLVVVTLVVAAIDRLLLRRASDEPVSVA